MNLSKQRTNHQPAKQKGLTLVEIMVALTISLILLAGILTIMASTKSTYRTTEALSRIQENGRYALNIISERVRSAVFVGCSSGNIGTITNKLNDAGDNRYNFGVSIEGYEADLTGLGVTYAITAANLVVSTDATEWDAPAGTSSTDLPADLLTPGVVKGNDVITVRAASDKGTKIDRNNDAAQLFISASEVIPNGCPNGTDDMVGGICPGDILVATDCNKSVVFQATAVSDTGGGSCTTSPCGNVVHSGAGTVTPGNAAPASWGGSSSDTFGPSGEILKMVTSVFYIGIGADGGPSLFLKENDDDPVELVDNVENMQILYGEDSNAATPVTSTSTPTPSIATRFVPADEVVDWSRVVSARVSLLLRTASLVRPQLDTQTYLTGGSAANSTTIDPTDDRRVRYVYTSTIKLRNKGLR